MPKACSHHLHGHGLLQHIGIQVGRLISQLRHQLLRLWQVWQGAHVDQYGSGFVLKGAGRWRGHGLRARVYNNNQGATISHQFQEVEEIINGMQSCICAE